MQAHPSYSSPMFGLGKKDSAPDGATEELADSHSAEQSVGRGRPTPHAKRLNRRRAALKGPVDPKARRKLEREEARDRRVAAREALMAGDERAFPPAMPGRFINMSATTSTADALWLSTSSRWRSSYSSSACSAVPTSR